MFRTVAIATFVAVCSVALGGPLSPPQGPITSTMKPLDAIEPRVCVNDLPGDEGAVVLIDQPGQYYLRADIDGEPGKHGIRIVADGDVSIDLNGFSVVGVPGSLNGIDMVASTGGRPDSYKLRSRERATISGWGGDGVRTDRVVRCECTHLLVADNGGNGISHLHAENIIHRDIATRSNGGDGVYATSPDDLAPTARLRHNWIQSRSRSNGGAGLRLVMSKKGYDHYVAKSDMSANVAGGIVLEEDDTLPEGSGAGVTTILDTTSSANGGDGVLVAIPCASPAVVVLERVSCVDNGGNGLEIDAYGTAMPHFGAACTISDSEFIANGENGVRSENPLHTESTTSGQNALYGLSVSGPDQGTEMYCGDTDHFISNGSGGALVDHGRFSGGRLSVSDNEGPGITVTIGCLVLSDSSITNNDGDGVHVTDGTLNVVSSTFRRNGGWGGVCGGTGAVCVMDDAVFELNGAGVANTGGMSLDGCLSVTLRRCVFNDNTGTGVRCRSSIGPVRWMAPEMIAQRNSGNGIDLDNITGGVLERCTTAGNGGVGILLGPACTKVRVDSCHATDDGSGGVWVLGTGNVVVSCSATANAAGAFNIAQGNASGIVISGGELPQSRDCNANVVW